jgi:hypothetical protein
MKKLGFLHDYHHNGISRNTPRWIYTLCETNVTLLAEFPDLDTGIFVDQRDEEAMEELLISDDEFRLLQDGFEDFHARDVEEAKSVVRTLTLIVFHGDTAMEAWAVQEFNRSYNENASSRPIAFMKSV